MDNYLHIIWRILSVLRIRGRLRLNGLVENRTPRDKRGKSLTDRRRKLPRLPARECVLNEDRSRRIYHVTRERVTTNRVIFCRSVSKEKVASDRFLHIDPAVRFRYRITPSNILLLLTMILNKYWPSDHYNIIKYNIKIVSIIIKYKEHVSRKLNRNQKWNFP